MISLVPLKNCLRKVTHQHSIEGGGGIQTCATGNPSHKVPHIKLYLLVRSLQMIDHNICLLVGDPTVQTAVHTWIAHWQSSNPCVCTAAMGDPALPSGI